MLAGVTIVDPAIDLDRARASSSRPTRPSTRSRCSAADRGRGRRRDRPARGRGRRRDRRRVRWSARSVTFAPEPSSTRGRRRARSWRSRTRGSARGTKVPHLSYIGDADIGEDTNIAAGNITANFPHEPGRPKGRTTIGATSGPVSTIRSLLRSRLETMLGLRPGSVITEDVPPGSLAGFAAAAGEQGRIGLRAWNSVATTELAACRASRP